MLKIHSIDYGFPDELPGGDEHPSSDASWINSIWMFFVFWDVSDWEETTF